MLKVGLTGGIGSGKSTASRYFQSLGAFVLDADEEAKKLITSNETVQHELISEFGTDIIDGTGRVDKNKLSRVAFQDEDHQQRLNSVVHPYIFNLIDTNLDNFITSAELIDYLNDRLDNNLKSHCRVLVLHS